MIFSTVAVTADTEKENAVCLTSTPQSSVQPRIENLNRGILWDQYDTDGSNGLSHADRSVFGYQRALLDDFEIPAGDTWVLEDFHSLNLWNTMSPPQGTDFHLEFWSDNNFQPGASLVTATTVSYSEAGTGRTWFGRPEFEITYKYEPITLTGGAEGTRYWIYGFVIGPENCFWMARETIWGSQCWCDYEDYPPMQPGSNIFGVEYDLAFRLTDITCDPCLDVEKYVWDNKNQEWVDADTEHEALEVCICNEVTFKIVIHNCGTEPMFDIWVEDMMHDSLKFISADPDPDDYAYDPPFYYMWWYFPGPLYPCEIIEIYITAHVEGPECSYDFNYVYVEGYQCGYYVWDEDYCYVHAKEKAREFNTPILDWLQNHPNMFPVLQLILKRLGLF
jgi:hypothetical protein